MKIKLTAIARLALAVLSLSAITAQLVRHASYHFTILNFFSYFTNLANITFAVTLLVCGGYTLLGRKPSQVFEVVRGAATLYMIIVGIIFSLLLRHEDLGTLMPWVNVTLHYLMPVVALADWLLLPPKTQFSKKQFGLWLLFPLAYLLYSLIRGAAVQWYPYPFLNPAKSHGYLGVSAYCVVILVFFLAASWGVARLARRKRN